MEGSSLAEYDRCLAALENVIRGPLQRRRANLLAAAHDVQTSMEAIRYLSEHLRTESSAEQASSKAAAEEHKLIVLQRFHAECLSDVAAIDEYVQRVLDAAAEPPPGATPAHFARVLIDRQADLLVEASHLLRPRGKGFVATRSDDSPTEMASRQLGNARLDALGQLLRVKDEVVRGLLDEVHTLRAQQAAHAAYAQRAFSFVKATQAQSHAELLHWASTSEAHRERIDDLQGELGSSRREVELLRQHCDELRGQNELLRARCESMQRLALPNAHEGESY